MGIKRPAILLAWLLSVQPAVAQQPQPDAMLLAQALDRCMATQAVRLTRTAATDSEIYAQARQSCLSLDEGLTAAINAQLPAAQAAEILRSINSQAEPNFMNMLSRIRTDRAQSGGQ